MSNIFNALGYVVGVILFLFVAYLGVCAYENKFQPSTTFQNPRVNGPLDYKAGGVIEIDYEVTRFRSCKLEVSRLVRRKFDYREFQIQFVVQPITADVPPYPRPSYYVAVLPMDLATGQYDVFSRVQYFCNVLDYIIPRLTDMEPVTINVEGISLNERPNRERG